MSSGTAGQRVRPDTDLTARARIRDAAVRVLGRDGMAASMRVIAAEAGVSAGLIVHHFGSKDQLRLECDEHVLRVIRDVKSDVLVDEDPGAIIQALSTVEEYVPLLAYALRSLQAGGAMARAFVDHMVADAEAYTAAAVAAGRLRPSRDAAGRARLMVLQNLGALMLLATVFTDDDEPLDPRAAIEEMAARFVLPGLEILTDGVLTDRQMLDSYLIYVTDPPTASSTAPSAPSSS